MSKLVSVEGDINDHGFGALVATQGSVYVNNKLVIVKGDNAVGDLKCATEGGDHCHPKADSGSATVLVDNKEVHRDYDIRKCFAGTVVIGQESVYVGDSPSSGTITSHIFSTNPEPVIQLTSHQKSVYKSNRVNVSKYNTPDNIDNGVDGHPEVEDDTPPAPVKAVEPNPNCGENRGDLGSSIDKVMQESAEGQWRETGNNPNINHLYKNVGFNISGDQTAWCAAFVGSVLKDNCYKFNKSLAAGSYTGYGNPIGINDAQKGDIIVFNRDGGTGHVAFYHSPGPTPGTIYVVGGNQSNNVTKSLRKISDIKPNGVQRPVV
jgi:uncharacterized protein (TIGR02594 family)